MHLCFGRSFDVIQLKRISVFLTEICCIPQPHVISHSWAQNLMFPTRQIQMTEGCACDLHLLSNNQTQIHCRNGIFGVPDLKPKRPENQADICTRTDFRAFTDSQKQRGFNFRHYRQLRANLSIKADGRRKIRATRSGSKYPCDLTLIGTD